MREPSEEEIAEYVASRLPPVDAVSTRTIPAPSAPVKAVIVDQKEKS